MRPIDHSSELSPDQRLQHVAHILAAGILRLHKRGIPPAGRSQPTAKIAPESGDSGLDLSGNPRLSVQRG